jgi:hypothetical protein
MVLRARWLLLIACAGILVTAGTAAAGMPKVLPLWQRVLQGGDLPGFIPQSAPPPLLSKAVFVRLSRENFVRVTPAEVTARLTMDGYRHAVIEELTGRNKTNAASAVVQFGSPLQAQDFASFLSEDTLQPCPNTCAVSAFRFAVPGIPGAKGTRRVQLTANGPKRPPFEQAFVIFTDGTVGYGLVERAGPNQVNKKALVAAAVKLYHRVHGSIPPPR